MSILGTIKRDGSSIEFTGLATILIVPVALAWLIAVASVFALTAIAYAVATPFVLAGKFGHRLSHSTTNTTGD